MSEIGQRQLKLTEKESEKDEKTVEEEDHIWGHVKEECDWMPEEVGRQNIVTFSFFVCLHLDGYGLESIQK